MRHLACLLLTASAAVVSAADSSSSARLGFKLLSSDYDLSIAGVDADGSWDEAYMVEYSMIGTLQSFGMWSATSGFGAIFGTQSEDTVDLSGGGARWYIGPSLGGDDFRIEMLPLLGVGWYRLTLGNSGDNNFIIEAGAVVNATVAFGGGWEAGVSGGVTWRTGGYDFDVDFGGGVEEVSADFTQLAFEYGASIGYRF